MLTSATLLATLRAQRLLAILRGTDRRSVVACGLTLIECGVRCLEVSLTSGAAFDTISELARLAGDHALIGAGTVVTKADAVRARDAGARFAVTPGLGAGVDGALAMGLPVLGGALTPTEVIAAKAKCAAVKLFPASLGGPEYLRALRGPLPEVPLVPVGGVDLESVDDYLDAGALAVGVGSPLVGDAASGGDLSQLRHRARQFVARTFRDI